jgi:hypothetical protein
MRGFLTSEMLLKSGWQRSTTTAGLPGPEMLERLGITLMDENNVDRAMRMSIVYVAICSFESSVREFISKKMLEEKGADWWDKYVKADVKKRAEQRRESEDSTKWVSPRGEEIINYTEFGDLISILSGNIKLFEAHIGTIEWAQSIVTPLEKMRHIIMHGGELDLRDIERVGINIRDWISQVG